MTNPTSPTGFHMSDTVAPTIVTPTQPPVAVNPTAMVKSFSLWGSIIAVLGWILQPNVLAILPSTVSHIMTAIGIVLSIFGIRTAIAKNGTGQ